jgi:hypothetical protein
MDAGALARAKILPFYDMRWFASKAVQVARACRRTGRYGVSDSEIDGSNLRAKRQS